MKIFPYLHKVMSWWVQTNIQSNIYFLMSMKLNIQSPKKFLKAFLKQKPHRTEIELFKSNLITLLDKITLIEQRPKDESEEHLKNDLRDFLRDTFYKETNGINTKDKKDLVIHIGKTTDSDAGVIIEAKRPTNIGEMVTPENPNKKALHELILYYLDERIQSNNNQLKHLVVTNVNEWFVIDANQFDKHIYRNGEIKKLYDTKLNDKKDNPFFYEEIAKIVSKLDIEIPCVYFDIREYEAILRNNRKEDDRELCALFKILSPQHLLKIATPNDSNSLDEKFYKELLHIIGLEEAKEGTKNIIRRKKENRNPASLMESTIDALTTEDKLRHLPDQSIYGETIDEQLFNVSLELCITWINRILFLKLLEGQLVTYHQGNVDYRFLNIKTINSFDELFKLFHKVLAKNIEDRTEAIKNKYSKVPYLNSSLFEISELEDHTIKINALDNDAQLELINTTILKDVRKKSSKLPTLDYLFQFLDAYNFASVDTADILEDNKTIINASVLGKVFEKINGYKDGSIFTPAFITMYMCNQSIRMAVVEKFNKALSVDGQILFEKFEDVKNYASRIYKTQEILKANEIINSLRICDPAVGSGHFLVSSLNEIIAIKAELGILADENGSSISGYEIEIVNDELIITDSNSNIYEYKLLNGKPINKECQRLQKTLFHEKQTIIENCLFGVDINPNSVKICRLRLWIELLKNAYYKEEVTSNEFEKYGELETLPNIDINIKCGNSLLSRFALDADLTKALKNSKYDVVAYRDFVNKYKNEKSRDVKRELQSIIDNIKNNLRTEILNNDPKIVQWKKFSSELYNLVNQEKLFALNAKQKKVQKDKQKKLALEISKLNKEIEEIKTNAIYKNAFEWRFEFPEVLNNNGDFEGFDLVIGNPPYIQIQSLPAEQKRAYQSNNYASYDNSADVYCLFYELSLKLVVPNGYVSFITSNKFIRSKYGLNTRNILRQKQLLELIDFGELPVFENAATFPLILMLKNSNSNYVFKYSQIDTLKFVKLEDVLPEKTFNVDYQSLSTYAWNLINPETANILQKMRKDSIKLGSFVNNQIYFGLKTGLNKAFIISEEMKTEFIKSDMRISSFIKPVITGDEMRRYECRYKKRYILVIKSGMDISDYPTLVSHFEKFKNELKKRTDKGKEYWQLRSCDYYDKFDKSKIHIPAFAMEPRFPFDNNGFYSLGPAYFISTNSKYLAAIMNSKLFWFFLKRITPVLGNEEDKGRLVIRTVYLQEAPIKQTSEKMQKLYIDLVDRIFKAKKQGKDSTVLEKKIDELVYELYGLTEEEIKIVEESIS